MRSFLLFLSSLLATLFVHAQSGVISGKVIDNSTGQPLAAATVTLVEKTRTQVTDVNGRFVFGKLPEGVYSIRCSYAGFTEKVVDQIVVAAGSSNPEVVITLVQKDMSSVVVTATRTRAAGETVSSLLIAQKNASSVSDGISAEVIRKTPDKSTSDVLKRISGSSIQDDRFVVLRGLNDRYNAAFINGAPLPSTESDRKAFAFDLLPSAILDNLVIYKTATPDKSGEFAGGIIDITTKSAVAKNFLQVTGGVSVNSLATGNLRYFSANKGRTDWIGIDDGSRRMPAGLPSTAEIRNQLSFAERADLAKRFSNHRWGVLTETTRSNYNLQLSRGFSISRKGAEFIGALLSVNYNRNFTFTTGKRNSYDDAIVGTTQEPFQRANYTDSLYNDEVIASALANFSIRLNARNSLSFKNSLNINADNKLVKRSGNPDFGADSLDFQTETVRIYTSNRIYSSQLTGTHLLSNGKTRLNWLGGYSDVMREIPNLARTAYAGRLPDKENVVANFVAPPNQTSGSGTMFFSKSDEQIYNLRTDLSQPFSFLKWAPGTFKAGLGYQSRKRSFTSRVLGFNPYNNGVTFDNSLLSLPEDQIFRPGNLGLMANGMGGFFLNDGTLPNSDYTASSSIWNAYLMSEQHLWSKLRLIYGARLERFNQRLNTIKNLRDTVSINTTVVDLLPSLNVVYALTPKINIRLAASQTVNRPEFRELAPFLFFDYVTNLTFEGQTTLQRAKITNYDVRFEVYPGNAQLFSVSGFYKSFNNPIEILSIPNTTNQAIYANTTSARVYGVETEFRVLISTLFRSRPQSFLGRWALSGNLALIRSSIKVDSFLGIPASQLITDRALQGQSPYVINGGISYTDEKSGFSSTLSMNRTGERIFIAGTALTASIYERARTVVDVQVAKTFLNKLIELKLTVKDLLAQSLNFYYDFDRSKNYSLQDRFFSTNQMPRTVSLSASFRFDY